MATNVELEPKLIKEAQRIGGHKTKRETIESALREYVQHRKQADIIALFGTIDFDEDYDYKASRKRK
jgi:Arc/MetJ family transcription regulator